MTTMFFGFVIGGVWWASLIGMLVEIQAEQRRNARAIEGKLGELRVMMGKLGELRVMMEIQAKKLAEFEKEATHG